ncbi:MAG: helix-turn-helix transcriptional regulator, partial [Ktedonobacteraceae bacterium]|nr:helix-turn-helix transcriptional regulator [Ktedonobacteraceae bacterium]
SINEAPRSAKISPDRQAILDLLEANDRPLTPLEVADILSIEAEKSRKKLHLLCKAGLICNIGHGLYQSIKKPVVVQPSLDQLDELF